MTSFNFAPAGDIAREALEREDWKEYQYELFNEKEARLRDAKRELIERLQELSTAINETIIPTIDEVVDEASIQWVVDLDKLPELAPISYWLSGVGSDRLYRAWDLC